MGASSFSSSSRVNMLLARRLFGFSWSCRLGRSRRGCRGGRRCWRRGGRRIVLRLSNHRVGGQGCGHRQSEQTMRALRAAAECTHHWRALPFPTSHTAGDPLAARTSAPLPNVKKRFSAPGQHPLLEMSGCASRKHGVDGGEQIRRDGSFEDKSIGPRFNRRELGVLFVVDAESDQLSRGKWLRIRRINPSPSPRRSERSTTAIATRSCRALSNSETSSPHHHNRLELCLKEAAHAFHQAKMPICQKRATTLFRRHLFISCSPPRAS